MGLFKKKKKKVDWAFMTDEQLIEQFSMRRGEIKAAPVKAKRAAKAKKLVAGASKVNSTIADDKARNGLVEKLGSIFK